MSWGIFQDGDKEFDLSHLDDAVISLKVGDSEYGVLVHFSDHCFTVDATDDDTRPKFNGGSRRDGRFCEVRYAASLKIRELLHRAINGKVWIGAEGRYLIAAITTVEGGQTLHYVIPFSLERFRGQSGIHLRMRVRSAFVRTDDRHVATYGEVRFSNLVTLVLQGKFPKRITNGNRKKPW